MTIRKGQEWGTVVEGKGVREVRTDSQLLYGRCAPVGGDLALTIGAPQSVNVQMAKWRELPVDRLKVTLDGHHEYVAVAHVQIGSWWRHRFVLISNVAYFKGAVLFSRSHPNDGKCEVLVLEKTMSLRQRMLAFQRRKSLAHLPHPHIQSSQVVAVSFEASSPVRIKIDLAKVKKAKNIHIEVIPDAGFVYIASSAT